MTLQEKIKKDYIDAMKSKNANKVGVLRILLGEFAREPNKEIPDNIVVKIINKMIKSEKETIELRDKNENIKETGNFYIDLLESYIPKQVGEDEIRKWINENIDFNSLKNKMQAIGLVTKHFGVNVDGNLVKGIIQGMG